MLTPCCLERGWQGPEAGHPSSPLWGWEVWQPMGPTPMCQAQLEPDETWPGGRGARLGRLLLLFGS